MPLAITNTYSAFGLWINRNGNVTSNGAFAAGMPAVDTPMTNIAFNGSALGWLVFPHASHNVELIQGTTLINVDFSHYLVTHMRILLPNMVLTGDNAQIVSPTGQQPNTFKIELSGTLNGQRHDGKGLGIFFGPDATETVVVFEVRPIASDNQSVIGTKESLVVDGVVGAAIAPKPPCDSGEFDVNVYLKLINQYWADQFAEAARQGLVDDRLWQPPQYKEGGNKFGYSPSNLTIWSGPRDLNGLDFLDREVRDFGAIAAILALAHEFGHHVQKLGGFNPELAPELDRELDADRLAGAYLGELQRQESLGSCDIAAAIRAVLAKGSTLPTTRAGHGTSEQRANAVLDGFLNGPKPFTRPSFPPNPKPVPGSGF